MAELEVADGPVDVEAVGRIGHVGVEVEDLAADRLEGPVQLGQVGEHDEQLAEGHGAGLHPAHAHVQHGRRAHAGREVEHHAEEALEQGQPQPGPYALPRAADEALLFPLLAAEGLDHAHGGQRLVDDPHGVAVELPRRDVAGAHPRVIEPGRQEQERRHRQGDDGQLPADLGDDEHHADEQHDRRDQRNGGADRRVLERRRIPLDSVHGIRSALQIVIRHRQPLDVAEELGPETEREPLPGLGLEHVRADVEHLAHDDEQDFHGGRQQ